MHTYTITIIKMSNKTRDVVKIIFQNFWKSLQPRQINGTLIGQDYFGNKFYEIPPNAKIGKRKASRWFEPPDKEDFEQEITAEWEAWLRGRRIEPPTEEELVKNYTVMQMKKRNAKLLNAEFAKTKDPAEVPKEEKGFNTFPKYDEYELMAGQEKKKPK